MNDTVVSLIFKGIDQLTGTVDKIHGKLGTLEKGVSAVNTKVGLLQGSFGRLHSVIQGIGQGIGQRIFFALEQGIHRVLTLIPDLIGRGEQFVTTVRKLVEVTGMLPEQASVLATAANILGVDVDALGTGLARMANNAVTNEEKFAKMGITIAKNVDGSVNLWQTLANLRAATSSAGFSAESTAAAIQLMGRGAKELIPILGLTNEQFDAMAAEAHRAGTYLTQAGLDAATVWERTHNRIENALTGVGTQILGNLAPTLSNLVDTITNTIEANMTQIINFVSQVVNFIAGMVSGLLGVTLVTKPFATAFSEVTTGADAAGVAWQNYLDRQKKAGSGTDTTTKSINKSIDAIDRQIAALDKQERAQNARQQRDEIVAQIDQLQAQLDDMKGKAVFTAGMSALEAELARQAQAQSIVDQEKSLQDAKDRLAEHDAQVARDLRRQQLEDEKKALQDRLTAHRKALAGQKAALMDFGAFLKKWQKEHPPAGDEPVPGSSHDKYGRPIIPQASPVDTIAAAAQQAGKDFGKKIDDFATDVGNFIDSVKSFVDTISPFLPLVATAIAVKTGGGWVGSILKMLGLGGAGAVVAGGGGGGISAFDPTGQRGPFGFLRSLFTDPLALPTLLAGTNPGSGQEPARQFVGNVTKGTPVESATLSADSIVRDLQLRIFGPNSVDPTTGRPFVSKVSSELPKNVPTVSSWASPDSQDRQTTALQKIATAVTPGGSFFQQIYDQSGHTSRTADASENAATASQATSDNIANGIQTKVTNTPTVDSASTFKTDLPYAVRSNIKQIGA
ncbi:MAG: phage tail tape measure protein, partial [Salinibacterium sp.]